MNESPHRSRLLVGVENIFREPADLTSLVEQLVLDLFKSGQLFVTPVFLVGLARDHVSEFFDVTDLSHQIELKHGRVIRQFVFTIPHFFQFAVLVNNLHHQIHHTTSQMHMTNHGVIDISQFLSELGNRAS